MSGGRTDRQARRRNSEGHEPEGVTYSDGQALERLGLGKVEQHLPFDGIAFEEQRRVLRIHRSAPDFEGNPIATALILEHIAMFVPEACPKRSWHRGVCWWFVVTILHDQGANRAIDGGPPEGLSFILKCPLDQRVKSVHEGNDHWQMMRLRALPRLGS